MTAEGALKDIRVLDLGHVIAGPFAATLLADLGADVVKIEHPLRGDTIRSLGPRRCGGRSPGATSARSRSTSANRRASASCFVS